MLTGKPIVPLSTQQHSGGKKQVHCGMHEGDLHETAEASLLKAGHSAVILFLSLTSSDLTVVLQQYETEEDKQGKTKCDSQDGAGDSRGL